MAITALDSRTPALDLPPPYSLVTLREAGDAFAHACRIAGDAGAGTLVWVRRFDLIEVAVVLEPEEPLLSARRAVYGGMNALADAIASHCPPEREIVFDWPGTILFNGACIGGGRLGWPRGCSESEVPSWLVFSAMIRAAWVGMPDPGLLPTATSLEEEGFETDPAALVEAFSRYLMLSFDILSEQGFEAVAERYLARLSTRNAGEHRLIDRNGDLLIRRDGREAERFALVPALDEPAWLDRETGVPKV